MARSFDLSARAIIEHENTQRQHPYSVDTLSRIGKPGFKTDVADSPDIYRLDGSSRADDAVLIVSNPAFPDFAIAAATRAKAAHDRMSAALGRHVLAARSIGHHDGRSYALYPRLQPLSKTRLIRSAQIGWVQKPVFQWLCDLATETQVPAAQKAEVEQSFLTPYAYLQGENTFSDTVRTHAAQAVAMIADGRFRPVTILQHGDFWSGNLLLGNGWPRASEGARFFAVIDWGSSSLTGYPFIDLLRLARSTGQGDAPLARRLSRYATASGVPDGDLLHYVCAHTGQLGLNRNEFPFDRYVQAMETLFTAAARLDHRIRSAQ